MEFKVVFKKDLIIGNEDINLVISVKKDIEYCFTKDSLESLLYLNNKNIKSYEEINFNTECTKIKNAKHLFIYRPGGIGDLLFILPYLKEIKKLNPNIKIDFGTYSSNAPILGLSKYIDNIITDPIEYKEVIKTYDKVIFMKNFIEKNPQAEIENAYDIGKYFFDNIKISPPFESVIKVKPVKFSNRDNFKINIMIQFASSVPIRDINPVTWWEFIKNLNLDKYHITFVGHNSQKVDIIETIKMIQKYKKDDISYYTTSKLEDMIIFILKQNIPHIFIGPDSGLTNLAAYHNIPTVGLYGPFPSHLRMGYYQNSIGIDSESNCKYYSQIKKGCFIHRTGNCPLANFKNQKYSPCLEKINADYIAQAIDFLIKKVYINRGSLPEESVIE